MLRFSRETHRIKVDPLSLTLAPLLDIWKADRDPEKIDATKILTYIHLASQIDQSAPYSRADPEEVGALVKKDLWGSYDYTISLDDITEDQVNEAIIYYQSAFEGPEEASVRAFDKKIYEIRKLVEETKILIKETTSRGITSFTSNFPIINKMMQDITKITKARDELKASIIKQTTRDTLKGKQKLSFADNRRKKIKEIREAKVQLPEEEPEDL